MLMPGPLWTCLALMWLGSSSAHSLFTCKPMKVHRCLGISYNMTFFPNMMDHFDQDIAATHMKVSPKRKYQYFWVKRRCVMPSSTCYISFLTGKWVICLCQSVCRMYSCQLTQATQHQICSENDCSLNAGQQLLSQHLQENLHFFSSLCGIKALDLFFVQMCILYPDIPKGPSLGLLWKK